MILTKGVRTLNSSIKWLLAVLSAFMRGDAPPMPPEDVNHALASRVAAFAHIDAILYYAKQSLGIPTDQDEDDRFINGVMLDSEQARAKEELMRALTRVGIRLIPLKGMRLKSLYPTSDCRYMGDLDFLYEGDDEALLGVMRSLGYTPTLWKRSTVHHVFKRDDVSIELHFRLLHNKSPLEVPLSDLADRLIPSEEGSGVYDLAPSDFYLHLIAHAVMHLLEGGTGIRTFLDLGLYLKAHPELLSDARVRAALREEGLLPFEEQARRLAAVLLDGCDPSEEDEKILRGLLRSGIFGTEQGYAARSMSRVNDKKSPSRLRYLISRLFPSHEALSSLYPRDGKPTHSRILYPVLWLRRLFDIAFSRSRRKRIASTLSAAASVGEEQLAAVRFEQEYFGVAALVGNYEVHSDED